MSLMETLKEQGVTAEDLEKAASVRLFEKVAASENVDLNRLNETQVDELYDHFVQNVLPTMGGEEGVQEPTPELKTAAAHEQAAATVLFLKQASDEQIDLGGMDGAKINELYAHFTENILPDMLKEEPAEGEKEAGMRPPTVCLFEKVAADENIDLDGLSDEQLGGLYGHFLNEVLPSMLPSEAAPEAAPESKTASAEDVEEAAAKLAEADILGRQMATSFMAELNKQAEAAPAAKEEKNASTPLFDKLAEERAAEILKANGVEPDAEPQLDDMVNARAVELLQARGFSFEE